MKIIATSDTHGTLPEIGEACDLFIHAGDIADHSVNYKDEFLESVYQTNWMESTFKPWFDKIDSEYAVCVPGNHDVWASLQIPTHNNFRDFLENTITFEGSNISVGGKWIGIWPFTRPVPPEGRGFPYWWGSMSEETQKELLPQILCPDIDILVSHAPPYGLCDFEGHHYGSIALRVLLDAGHWPKLTHLFCGHIHLPSEKECDYRGIRIINCAKRIVSLEI